MQAGRTVPCPGLDVTVPPGLGKDWQQQEGRGQGSEWGKGSNKVQNKGAVALPAARSLVSLTSCQQSRKADLKKQT